MTWQNLAPLKWSIPAQSQILCWNIYVRVGSWIFTLDLWYKKQRAISFSAATLCYFYGTYLPSSFCGRDSSMLDQWEQYSFFVVNLSLKILLDAYATLIASTSDPDLSSIPVMGPAR